MRVGGVHHHRDVQDGTVRAAVFGISDGLVSNVALILGMAGASTDPSIVRVAGISGLLALLTDRYLHLPFQVLKQHLIRVHH
jgi:hypothetical protein